MAGATQPWLLAIPSEVCRHLTVVYLGSGVILSVEKSKEIAMNATTVNLLSSIAVLT